MRRQQIRDPDGSCHDPAQYPALLVSDEREGDGEDGELHDVHPEDPGYQEVHIAEAHALDGFVFHSDHGSRLRDGERKPVDDLREDLPPDGDLLRARVVAIDDELRHRLTGARRRDRELPRNDDQHVQLGTPQTFQGLVRALLCDLQGLDPFQHAQELLAGVVLRLVVDGE